MHLIPDFVLKQVAYFFLYSVSLGMETGYSEKIFIIFLSPSM